MQLSVVLPCYNEETNIAAAVRDVNGWMDKEKVDGEIVVVNDGSKDNSLKVLESLKPEFPRLRIVNRAKNGGYGLALRDGCDAVKTEWIAYMDSDGQFKAEDLSKLVALKDKADFVTGRRAHRADPLKRNMFGKILGAANFVWFGVWVRDVNCGMKMYKKDLWPKIRPEQGVEKLFNTAMFIKLKRQGIRWETVNVNHYPRTSGNPTGGSVKMIFQTLHELWSLKRAPV
jgi:glycosyltransferase involved in cell wall biosynthesis